VSRSSIRWLSLGFLLLGLVALAVVVLSVRGMGRLLIIAALLAYVLRPVASRFESLGFSRNVATVIVFVLLGVLGVGVGLLIYPVFTAQLQALQHGDYADQANSLIGKAQTTIRHNFAFIGLDKLNLADEVERGRVQLGKALSKFLLTDLVPSVVYLVAIPFTSFFLLKDGRNLKKWLIGLVPNRYFEFSLDVLYKMDLALGNFLRGQFLDGLIFGVLTTLTMWVLNVKYSLLIGMFAGVANLIPYVGPIAGAALAVMVVLLTTADLTHVMVVIFAFLLVKLVDDTVIQPVTVGRSVRMHPLVILLVIIIGGHYFGVLGMLLAVPAAGFLKVAVQAGSSLFRKYRFTLLTETVHTRPVLRP
jgi:putative permease